MLRERRHESEPASDELHKTRQRDNSEVKEKLKMILKRITNILAPMYYKALGLYQMSFPDHEQREKHSQEKIIKDHKRP